MGINKFIDNGIYTIWIDAPQIDILVDIEPKKPLVFIWKGNTRRNADIKMPIFVGFSMVTQKEASRISISDPSMYCDEKLGLAWYSGSSIIQETIFRAVAHIGKIADPSKVIHLGGSGGGYAAMLYSLANPNALAVPWNPQNNILNYEKNAVNFFLQACYKINNDDSAYDVLQKEITCKISDLYKNNTTSNYLLYLQNIEDTHVKDHLSDFTTELSLDFQTKTGLQSLSKNKLLYLSNKWGEGHNPPSNNFLKNFFSALITSNIPIKNLFKDTSELDNILNQSDI